MPHLTAFTPNDFQLDADTVSDEFAARTHTDDTGDDAAPLAAPGG